MKKKNTPQALKIENDIKIKMNQKKKSGVKRKALNKKIDLQRDITVIMTEFCCDYVQFCKITCTTCNLFLIYKIETFLPCFSKFEHQKNTRKTLPLKKKRIICIVRYLEQESMFVDA